ncbi:acyltransferase domain-containing protein, partial [Streptomyces sp. 2MCAF27]
GEIAAATVAGALSLHDAAKVVALRSQTLRTLTGQGTMASLALSQQETSHLLAELDTPTADVALAAANSPTSTVISGPPEQVATVVTACQDRGSRARTIDVDYASHGPQVDKIADELASRLKDVQAAGNTDIAFYSTVTGERFDTTGLDAAYWFTNLRQQVRFTDTVETLLTDGYRVFIEASPHPVLTPALQETFEHANTPATALATLR